MNKKHVCPIDGRGFQTAAALNQHRADAHGSGQMKPATQRRSKVPRQPTGSAVVATSEVVRGLQSDSARMSGIDRIFHGAINIGMPSQKVLCDLLVTPGLFRRLSVVAKAYQKIRYLKLKFRVEPQVSTTTSGGYVVGFVRDPADNVVDINNLTAQQGSMTTKWWQSASVTGPVSSRDFYTSEGVEIREYSPGRLVVMVDGPATQAGSVTIFAEWSVQLSSPSLEDQGTVSKQIVALQDWWTQAGHVGFFLRNDDGSFNDGSAATMISEWQTGDFYRPEADCIYPSATAGNYNSLTWVYIKGPNDLIPCWGMRTEQDTGALAEHFRVVRKGTVFSRYVAPSVSGEELPPSSYVLQTTTAEQQLLSRLCYMLHKQLSPDLFGSRSCLSDSPELVEISDCMGKPS